MSEIAPFQIPCLKGISIWLYRMVCGFMILTIIGIPLCNITCSIEFGDTFFAVNMYRFFESAPDSLCLPLFLTSYLGYLLTRLAEACDIPQLLALRLSVVFCFWGACGFFFLCFRRQLGMLTLLTGMAAGACFSKAGLYMFYYTQVSQLAICLMAILILKAIERKSLWLFCISAFVSVCTVFLRISNAAFLCLYLLMFMRSNLRSVNWKKETTALFIGAAAALMLVSVIIHQTIGWERALQLPDVIRYTAVDGHTISFLLFLIIRGIISKDGIYLCCLAVPLFVLLYCLFLPIAPARLRKILIGVVSAVFVGLLCIHTNLFNFFLSPDPWKYPGNGFILSSAIQFVIWLNAGLLALSMVKKTNPSNRRLLAASLIVTLVGPFGSNTQQIPAIYSAFFYLPIVLYGLKLCWRGDLCRSSVLCRNRWLTPARKAGTASVSLILAITFFFSFFLSLTYTFTARFPLPLLHSRALLPAPDNAVISHISLLPHEKEDIDAYLTECKPYIKPGTPLISMPDPVANALLDAPPALKWRGGDTEFSPPESIQEQLHCAKELPAFVLYCKGPKKLGCYHSFDGTFDRKVLIAESFAQEKGYQTITTLHFKILLPPSKDAQRK